MTKIDVIRFWKEDRPQFPECPRATPDSIIGTWSNGTPIIMCRMYGIYHTCEWRHKKTTRKDELCPYGTVY